MHSEQSIGTKKRTEHIRDTIYAPGLENFNAIKGIGGARCFISRIDSYKNLIFEKVILEVEQCLAKADLEGAEKRLEKLSQEKIASIHAKKMNP